MAYATDAARWRALATRDANANGHFIYTVKSTNIYCRPTCPARLARRANVGFYRTSSEAEANGFRACKRCKPDALLEDPQAMAVEKACKIIEEAVKNDNFKAIRLHDLAKNVGLTPRYFHKIFKDRKGVTPKEWATGRATTQGITDAIPSLAASPLSDQALDTFDWDGSNYNNFNQLVDFDMDGGATLGYNLTTGADQPVSMGYGNAIDVSILDELWTAGYTEAGAFLEDDNLMNTFGDAANTTPMWLAVGKRPSAVSTLELDVDALLRYDTVLF